MSRIDEALKRATPGPRVSVGAGRITTGHGQPADDVGLDHYPVEGAPPAAVAERVSVPVAPPVPEVRARSVAVPSAPRSEPQQVHPAPIQPVYPDLTQPVHSNLAQAEQHPNLTQAVHPNLTANPKLVVGPGQDMVCREQYRRLAATLHEAQATRGLKSLVVTSAVPKEGKTLTTINLALTFSESYGRKVLLIDADLRRPSVHEVLRIPNKAGLSQALRSAGPLQLATISVTPNLDVLPSGRVEKEPLAALSSARMPALLEYAKARYDWVIIDTPPLALMSDATIVAGLTQAVVFVIRAGATPYAVISKALENLGREVVLGTVLNGVNEAHTSAESYYGHYYSDNPE